MYSEDYDVEYHEMLPNKPYLDEDGNTIQFIPALVFDNLPLTVYDTKYVKFSNHSTKPDGKCGSKGNWDVLGSIFFDEFSKFHHVFQNETSASTKTPAESTAAWTGTAKPSACLFLHVNGGLRHRLRRNLLHRTHPIHAGPRNQTQSPPNGTTEDDIHATIVDPSMKIKSHEYLNSLHSTLDIYVDNGIEHITLGNNDRVQGWATFREFLRVPEQGEPFLRFTSNCVNCIETIPSLVTSAKNPEDLNTDGEDHTADALRYALMYIDKPFFRSPYQELKNWQKRIVKEHKELREPTEDDVWAQ